MQKMKSFLSWKEKSVLAKFVKSWVGILLVCLTSVTGLITIYQYIESWFAKPFIMMTRLSLGEHHITLGRKNLLGNELRYKHLGEKEELYNSSEMTLRLKNRSPNPQEYGNFSFAIKTVDGNQWRIYSDYVIMTLSENPNSLLGTSVIVPPYSSVDIELDFLIYESEPFLRQCATEYKVSWMDAYFEGYVIGEKFSKPTCQFESFARYYPVNSPVEGDGILYGRSNAHRK